MVGSLADAMPEMSGSASDSMTPETCYAEKLSKFLRIPLIVGTVVLVSVVCLASVTWHDHSRIPDGDTLQLSDKYQAPTDDKWMGPALCDWMCDKFSWKVELGYLGGYPPGVGGSGQKNIPMHRAQAYCAMNPECGGITCSPMECTLRRRGTVKVPNPNRERTWVKHANPEYTYTTGWKKFYETYKAGYARGVGGGGERGDLETMKEKCRQNTDCGGVVCEGYERDCTLRGKGPLIASKTGENTYIYCTSEDAGAGDACEKILQGNFPAA